jgi:hypothetical protein
MSGHQAIAAVTEALRQVLQAAGDAELPGTVVAVARPRERRTSVFVVTR